MSFIAQMREQFQDSRIADFFVIFLARQKNTLLRRFHVGGREVGLSARFSYRDDRNVLEPRSLQNPQHRRQLPFASVDHQKIGTSGVRFQITPSYELLHTREIVLSLKTLDGVMAIMLLGRASPHKDHTASHIGAALEVGNIQTLHSDRKPR